MFASYITFDLSPELAITEVPDDADAKASFVLMRFPRTWSRPLLKRVEQAGLSPTEDEFNGFAPTFGPR